MPVKIHVVYCGAWGYQSKAQRLKADLEDEFGADELEFTSYGTPTTTGWLEVEVNGKLVHSKKNGDGYIDSKAKMQKIIKNVEEAMASK